MPTTIPFLPAPLRRGIAAALFLLGLCATAPAFACTTSPTVTSDLGSYSPAAVGAGAVPALQSRAGFACSPGVLMLLSGNYIRATYQSRGGLTLVRSGGGGSIPYILSADPGGTVVAAQGGTIDYMQNNLLNLLGLLGGSNAELPFFVRPSGGTAPATGTYTDRVTVRWSWYLCQGIGLLGACVLGADTGSATTVVDVTLTVAPRSAVMTTSTVTIWDPVNTTRSPKAVPGSRQRINVTLTNPDLVPSSDHVLVVPLHENQQLAFDTPDGTAPIAFAASGASTLKLVYAGPADGADDIDFSVDTGRTWTHAPVAGAARADAIRFRPQGSLAPGGSLTVSFPVAVR